MADTLAVAVAAQLIQYARDLARDLVGPPRLADVERWIEGRPPLAAPDGGGLDRGALARAPQPGQPAGERDRNEGEDLQGVPPMS